MTRTEQRPRAILAHGIWGRGGAEAAAMWVIAALSHDFDVTIYSRGGFDLKELNALAGTEISSDDITLKLARTEKNIPLTGSIRAGIFLRTLHQIGSCYDLRVSVSGILPWNRPALHILSSIDFDPNLALRFWHNGRQPLRARISSAIQRAAAGSHPKQSGLFIANSEWLKARCSTIGDGRIEVIHPAVVAPPLNLSSKERENNVLVFGRISPEKRIEACIRIVESARERGFSGRLLIAGSNGPVRYARKIHAMAAARDWICMLPHQAGTERHALLGKVTYGLNACIYESFGISSAEMAAAGVVMLVPKDTGQSEIVDDPLQVYSSEEDAAERLFAMSQNSKLRRRLQEKALSTRGKFAPEIFISGVQRAAKQVLFSSMGREPHP